MTDNVPATTSGPALPSMVVTPYEEVSASDVMLPKLYLQQPLSNFVQDGIAKPGDLVMATGTDDAMPITLIDEDQDHVYAYVVARKKFAATTSGGGLTFHPDNKRDLNDPDSWEGWFFDLAVTEYEEMVPVRWMLWKTAGAPAARAINTLIERARASGDLDPIRIKITVKQKSNRNGQKYYAPQIAVAPPDADELEKAKAIQRQALALMSARSTENEAPPKAELPAFS